MKKKVIVFAGNSGLGLWLVRDLIHGGEYEVFSSYRTNSSELKDLYIGNGLDPEKFCLQGDLTVCEQTNSIFRQIASYGQIWGVINLAGSASAKRLTRMEPVEAEQVFLNNALPALFITKCAFDHMSQLDEQGGRIIHISSVTVKRPVPGAIPYIAAKAATEGIVRSSAVEGGRFAVTVNALRLGYFDAGMTLHVPPSILDAVRGSTASNRFGNSTDFFGAVRYILDVNSSFLTGSIIDLDGGLV